MRQGAIQLDISINNVSLSTNKKNLISLSVHRNIGEAANSFTLEVFDETAYQVENLLAGTGIADISVAYSAADDLKKENTITFTGMILTYNVSFVGRATMLSMEGVLTCGLTTSDTINWWFKKQSICWADPDNIDNVVTFRGQDSYGNETTLVSPTALFERIITEYNKLKPGAYPLAPGNDPAEHIPIEDLSTTQMNQTASEYITNVICPVSIYKDQSTGNLLPGFRYYVDGEGHHFKRSSLYDNIDIAKTYSIKFGQQNSNVISFSLAETGALVMANAYQDSDGNLLTSMSSLDKIYGQSVYQNYIASSNVNNVDNQVKLYTDSNLLSTSMVEIKSSSTQTGLSAKYSNVWNDLQTLPFEATLTIWR